MDRPDAGLCERCDFARRQKSARGSEFLRCARADVDPTYLRYPPLPVTECTGFEEASPCLPAPAGKSSRGVRARMRARQEAKQKEPEE